MGDFIIAPKSNGASIYSASKAFLNSVVKSAAIENAPRIRVTGVMPGLVATEILPLDGLNQWDAVAQGFQPLWGRAGRPHEIASLVSFLIGDESSFISGTNITADGLWSLSGGVLPDVSGP